MADLTDQQRWDRCDAPWKALEEAEADVLEVSRLAHHLVCRPAPAKAVEVITPVRWIVTYWRRPGLWRANRLMGGPQRYYNCRLAHLWRQSEPNLDWEAIETAARWITDGCRGKALALIGPTLFRQLMDRCFETKHIRCWQVVAEDLFAVRTREFECAADAWSLYSSRIKHWSAAPRFVTATGTTIDRVVRLHEIGRTRKPTDEAGPRWWVDAAPSRCAASWREGHEEYRASGPWLTDGTGATPGWLQRQVWDAEAPIAPTRYDRFVNRKGGNVDDAA